MMEVGARDPPYWRRYWPRWYIIGSYRWALLRRERALRVSISRQLLVTFSPVDCRAHFLQTVQTDVTHHTQCTFPSDLLSRRTEAIMYATRSAHFSSTDWGMPHAVHISFRRPDGLCPVHTTRRAIHTRFLHSDQYPDGLRLPHGNHVCQLIRVQTVQTDMYATHHTPHTTRRTDVCHTHCSSCHVRTDRPDGLRQCHTHFLQTSSCPHGLMYATHTTRRPAIGHTTRSARFLRPVRVWGSQCSEPDWVCHTDQFVSRQSSHTHHTQCTFPSEQQWKSSVFGETASCQKTTLLFNSIHSHQSNWWAWARWLYLLWPWDFCLRLTAWS